jgi:ribosomal protein S1
MDIGGIEGLVHISEVAWGRIDDLKSRFNIGDTIEVQIIDIDGNRVSLSIKRLLPDPWAEAVKAYSVGQNVTGEVTRVTPFGAFVKFDPVLDGLVRVSEIVDEGQAPGSILEVGKTYPFKILSIDNAARQIGLSYKQAV